MPLAWTGHGIRAPEGGESQLTKDKETGNREEPGEGGVQQGKCSPFLA